jgi:uncharacterized repeat protein (TIGR03803 family)
MRFISALVPVFLASSALASAATATTFTQIYKFNAATGENSFGKLVQDKNGLFYGTAYFFGPGGHGVVFRLSPPAEGKTKWTYDVLYSFADGADGAGPNGGLLLDKSGALYGTASQGGANDSGVIFALTPPGKGQTDWTETVLYNFTTAEGSPNGNLLRDSDGNIYGTCYSGAAGPGAVFRLSPPEAPQTGWSETVLHAFTGGSDGSAPSGRLAGDGNALYGTTHFGGASDIGTLYQMTPPQFGNGPWSETILHSFSGSDGSTPNGGVVKKGNRLYGVAYYGGAKGYGLVYEAMLPKPGHSQAHVTTIHDFAGLDGHGPWAGMTLGKNGMLYGSTVEGGDVGKNGWGAVFSLTPPATKGGSWTEQVLHSFDDKGDGNSPGELLLDQNGTLYGATEYGTKDNTGTLFQIVP